MDRFAESEKVKHWNDNTVKNNKKSQMSLTFLADNFQTEGSAQQ